MKSKYPLDPEFYYIEDNGIIPTERADLDAENAACIADATSRKADGKTLLEKTVVISGYDGAKIKLRIFEPAERGKSLPCIVYFHGGGFLYALQGHQVQMSMTFAEKVRCKVVVVDYRLSLDHPFPQGIEDSYKALCWTWNHADELDIDKKRLAVMGDSSGGAFAAAICQMSRDRIGPEICFQMLIYPVTDNTLSSASVKKYNDTPNFTSAGNAFMWKTYLREGDFGIPQYAAPLLASDFSNLPSAYIETAEFDCLHDEAVSYAKKLCDAGGKVELNETRGSFHGFDLEENAVYTQKVMQHRIDIWNKVFYH